MYRHQGLSRDIRELPHLYADVRNTDDVIVGNSPPCGTPRSYIDDMQQVIAGADLPQDRCILDALGWAQDVKGLVALGWEGYIGYLYLHLS